MKPGNLSGMLCDCHIYENQLSAAEEQIMREPKTLPQLSIEDNLRGIRIDGLWQVDKDLSITPAARDYFSIYEWKASNMQLENYSPHPKLDFGPVAV